VVSKSRRHERIGVPRVREAAFCVAEVIVETCRCQQSIEERAVQFEDRETAVDRLFISPFTADIDEESGDVDNEKAAFAISSGEPLFDESWSSRRASLKERWSRGAFTVANSRSSAPVTAICNPTSRCRGCQSFPTGNRTPLGAARYLMSRPWLSRPWLDGVRSVWHTPNNQAHTGSRGGSACRVAGQGARCCRAAPCW
jgi:hypothetical protein